MRILPMFLALVCFLASGVAALALQEVNPAQPVIPQGEFRLSDFGAVADGKTPNTAVFKKAIAAVEQAGGGTLIVAAGEYLTGPIDLCSRLNLRVEKGARLLFLTDPAEYQTAPGKFRPFVLGAGKQDVMISGEGVFDGQGASWWEEARRYKAEARAKGLTADTSPRPRLLIFDQCQRVRVEGITLTMAPQFTFMPVRSEDVTIEGITILNPDESPNTDGIDPSVSHRVWINRCVIDTGDDNIAVKSGMKGAGDTVDILVTNCTFRHGHGCSIGTETNNGLRNMTVRDCTFEGTDAAVRLKSERGRGGPVENVSYSNLTMKNVGHAIIITSFYPDKKVPKPGQLDTAPPATVNVPSWKNISIRNVKAEGCRKSAGWIMGLPESPAIGITLENIEISAPAGLRIGYARDVSLKNVRVTPAQGQPILIEATVENLQRVESP